MRHPNTPICALALALLASCLAPPPKGGGNVTSLTGLAGGRALLSSDTEPLDEQWSFGLEVDGRPADGGFGWETGVQVGRDTGNIGDVSIELTEVELYLGVRHTWSCGHRGHWRPFVGAGLLGMWAEAEADPISDDDIVPGAYVHVGASWDVVENFAIGLDLRGVLTSEASTEFGDAALSYAQAAVRFGFAF